MRAALVLLLLLPGGSAAAQTLPTVDALLDRLYAYVGDYRAKLPSLACVEAITSEFVKNGKVKKTARLKANFQYVHDGTKADTIADPFVEQPMVLTFDGNAHKPHITLPYFVFVGIWNAISFGLPERKSCFDYHLSAENGDGVLRLEATALQDLSAADCRDVIPSLRTTILIDANQFRVLRTEQWVSGDDAERHNSPFYFSMEYGPQTLGPETLWLPVRLISHDAKDEGRLEIDYSGYHRFTSEMRILPGDTPVAEQH
ncbi:MAG TPA: hypothetical protein VE291_00480 [Terracidiphilus sp.]|jgi:hypothetical protein|nr:hypothetical protein [Terracidiphilus sp.]